MADQIINRVANSILKTIDLEELYPTEKRAVLDIAPWLLEGIVLKEKDFRKEVENYNWELYKDQFVAIICSADAIIPAWAFMLISTKLAPFAKKAIIGTPQELETIIFYDIVNNLEIEQYIGKPIIIKGCSEKNIPPAAFGFLIAKLQPNVKSILYGEACSSVPLYKSSK